jgi:hypothetical protein
VTKRTLDNSGEIGIVLRMARTDTEQQKAILRQNKASRTMRARFRDGARVEGFTGKTGTGSFGTICYTIPHNNAQGGVVVVDWDNGRRGRHSPCSVRVV